MSDQPESPEQISPGMIHHYKRAAHQIGDLFCWCVQNLEKFPPREGDWIDEVKRRLKPPVTQSPPKPPIDETTTALRELPKLIGGRQFFINNSGGWSVWTQPALCGGEWLDRDGMWHSEHREWGNDLAATFPTREAAEDFVRGLLPAPPESPEQV